MEVFDLNEYDCIGLDLDCTLVRYNTKEQVKLEYNGLVNILIEKGYDSKYLLQPLDQDFLQKGLFLDFKNGNILKLGPDAVILKACHGTKPMMDEDIRRVYGQSKKWIIAEQLTKDFLSAWNGPISEEIRSVLDVFDIICPLAFGRIVDSIDNKAGREVGYYNIWPDMLSALGTMYIPDHYQSGEGGYFAEVKENPKKYMYNCSSALKTWLKTLKKDKFIYLITGSYIDFANFTASTVLGPDWQDYFDSIICFARKPNFFVKSNAFYKIDGFKKTDIVEPGQLKRKEVYCNGNWEELKAFMGKEVGKVNPKCLYIGDNLIQDVYTPAKYCDVDTVSVVEEISDDAFFKSQFWGSYFEYNNSPTYWGSIIQKYSKICVPTLECLVAQNKMKFPCFNNLLETGQSSGYIPFVPK